MKHYFLNEENVNELIGKKVKWTAEAYEHNRRYNGVDIIKSVDLSKHRPLETEVISGDNLGYAYLERYGLEPAPGISDTAYRLSKEAPRCFTYSDDFREVEICDVE